MLLYQKTEKEGEWVGGNGGGR